MADAKTISSGVQELIDRLREQGVRAGRTEADRLISEAREEAASILREAQEQARKHRQEALEEVQKEREAARAALEMAVRDTTLQMKTQLAARLAAQVRRLIHTKMQDPEFIGKLILAVAARASEQTKGERAIEVRIADVLFKDHGADRDPEANQHVHENLLGASADQLREGVTIHPAGDNQPGIRIRLTDSDAEIDLTDEAVSAVLMQRLLPRFRAMVEGVQERES